MECIYIQILHINYAANYFNIYEKC